MQARRHQSEPSPAAARPALLEVQDLSVAYGAARPVRVVDGVSFAVDEGEALGVVGESGCGKTQTMLAVMRLLPHGGKIVAGRVLMGGRDLVTLPVEEMRRVRGRGIAFISQDALSALNPSMTVGAQIAEPLIVYGGMSEAAARRRSIELLDHVGIPGAPARLASYPHQLSGGMRQRVLIAMAISAEPKILVADEPTTALDVTIQAQILALIDRLRRELGMALVLISHDLGVVAGVTDRVAIMYAGRVVETASTAAAFEHPRHPYTRALLEAIPRLDGPADAPLRPIPGRPPDPARPVAGCAFHPRCAHALARCAVDPPILAPQGDTGHRAACWVAGDLAGLARRPPSAPPGVRAASGALAPKSDIVVRDLRVHFPLRSAFLRRTVGTVRAVDGVSFRVPAGTTTGLVGESGSGKTTVGRALLGLTAPTGGDISYFARSLPELRRDRLALPRLGQMVFQDPYGSLNPRMTVGAALGEVLAVHGLASGAAIAGRVGELLDSVGLRPEAARRHPHELSGGQRQRVAIARALAIEPQFVVCDEVVSALDVSIQGQIVNLLKELQRGRGLTYLFISHDLSVVRSIAHQVVVMYGGKVMEIARRDDLFAAPRHPYTHALLAAVPVPDPAVERGRRRADARSEPPDPSAPPPGCRFQRSCRFATDQCRDQEPALEPLADGRAVACHRWTSEEVRTALADAPGLPRNDRTG